MTNKIALITGASAGIGYELAKLFAAAKHRVVLVARRADRLQTLADEIVSAGGEKPIIIACDLATPGAADSIAQTLKDEQVEIEYLVNNAGFGLLGSVFRLDRREQIAMIDLNVRALTDLCLCFADQLIRNKGGILNVGSLAGFLPGPRMAIYYASKAFVVSFSEAIHTEFRKQGVRVTVLCPGPVPTEFQARAGMAPGMNNEVMNVSAVKVAKQGFDGLMAGKRLVIPGAGMTMVPLVLRFVPKAALLKLIYKTQNAR